MTREPGKGDGFLYRAYQRRLRNQIEPLVKPRHIAMILDGNRRWAKLNALASAGHGHRAGAAKMSEFLEWCDDLGVEVVTLYLLSNDNLTGREPAELGDLYEIIAELADGLSRRPGWRIRHVGDSSSLPTQLVSVLHAAEARSATNTKLHVNLAVGYGGRHELIAAMRSIVEKHQGSLSELAATLTPELIGDHLYTNGQPDPDLVIRTSGEQRLSDFMVWQSAHSEFYFMEALGPDLREVDFLRAVRAFGLRDRRYGK
ncbi:polyprenyl diphosphate synthase [Humidisolicoccus flavus]|uniref:polyprenyl diphosphate synthase n=1 Tax=Humidisolicoccus flavus TaxID=3111414 RepID=UPI003253C526